ncbi:MAG: hypothetical protein CVT48_05430 [Thermoplasmata archaeon HGW-Thermoplasmata-1]|nr:MAG: hypothetical protein CVT48_05430 [Thermoplasmata archaeon HGW-Thermoplasmata-1]
MRAPPDASDSCVVAVSCSGAVLELTVNVAGWENGDTDSGGSGFLGLPGFGLPSLLVTLVAMVLCIRRRPDEG